jgi:pimeloyl-ACP methyl ester carboxylesterase
VTTLLGPDGTRLAYSRAGEGPLLVCLPGGPMQASAYLGDLGGLTAHRSLVLPDLRGTGASAVPADPSTYRCDRQVGDVEALRAHLGADRLDLLAHSAGAALALLYAARHPDRVGSLVLVTPSPRVVGVEVTDDVLGTVLPTSDAKRHWRTDSVEIAIDPRGNSENTSSTYKVGVFPTTTEGPPAAYRDADNRQGPVAETSPGFEVASTVRQPYDGYTLEVKIPFANLPAAVRPDATGLNVFIYDSDTQDKTGQTRLGWSTWGGVQGDPYRWGKASFEGYTPPPELPTDPTQPVIPSEVALSVNSPQSIMQAASDGVALAGGPQAIDLIAISGRPRIVGGDTLVVRLRADGPGTAHVFATDSAGRGLGSKVVDVTGAGVVAVAVPFDPAAGTPAAVVAAFEAASGGTHSVSKPLEGG